MIEIGIMGFGKMGIFHGALLAGSGKARIRAICDKSLVMRIGFKHLYKNVHTYKDIDKMLNREKLDILIIATPTFNHESSVTKAIEKGCSIFVEKPLASSLRSAIQLCELAEKSDTKIQVGFCNRFLPTFSKAKLLLREGAIGNVNHVEAQMFIGDVFEPHTGWRYKKEMSGGGALMDFGIHMVDMLVWLFGTVNTVTAKERKLYSVEVEDELDAEIVFDSQVTCHFETSWSKDEYRKSYSRIVVTGSKGSMEVTDQTINIFDLQGAKKSDYTYPDLYGGSFMDIGGILYSNQIEAFLSYLETGSPQGCTVQEAAYVQKVVDRMYYSAQNQVSTEIGGVVSCR